MNILKPNRPQPPSSPQPPPQNAQLPRMVPQMRPPTNQLHEDALRFGQQIVDLQATASRLHAELEDMTARAKLAEEEVRRLETRISYMEKAFEQRESSLSNDRDKWKMLYADVEKSLQLAGQIILDVVKKSETRQRTHVNLTTLAETISNPPSAEGGGHPEKSWPQLADSPSDQLDKEISDEIDKIKASANRPQQD